MQRRCLHAAVVALVLAMAPQVPLANAACIMAHDDVLQRAWPWQQNIVLRPHQGACYVSHGVPWFILQTLR